MGSLCAPVPKQSPHAHTPHPLQSPHHRGHAPRSNIPPSRARFTRPDPPHAPHARSPNPSHLSHRLFPIGVLRALTNGRGVAHERSFASSSARDRARTRTRTRTRSSLARRPRAPNPPHIARSNRLVSARALDTTLDTTPTDARAMTTPRARAASPSAPRASSPSAPAQTRAFLNPKP